MGRFFGTSAGAVGKPEEMVVGSRLAVADLAASSIEEGEARASRYFVFLMIPAKPGMKSEPSSLIRIPILSRPQVR